MCPVCRFPLKINKNMKCFEETGCAFFIWFLLFILIFKCYQWNSNKHSNSWPLIENANFSFCSTSISNNRRITRQKWTCVTFLLMLTVYTSCIWYDSVCIVSIGLRFDDDKDQNRFEFNQIVYCVDWNDCTFDLNWTDEALILYFICSFAKALFRPQ